MKYFWILLLILIFTVFAEFIRKRALQKNLNSIYDAAYKQNDEELFNLLIESPQAKMLMSDASRLLIKLNYYITINQDEKIIKTVNKLRSMRLDKNSRKSFYSSAIGTYCEKQWDDAVSLCEELQEKAQNSKDQDLILLYLDCRLLVDIYIHKDISKASALEEIINSEIDDHSKVIYMIRLARLYDLNYQKESCHKWLKKAQSIAKGPARKKVDSLLKKGWN